MQRSYYIFRVHCSHKVGTRLDTRSFDVTNITVLVVDDCTTSTMLIKQQLLSLGLLLKNITCVNKAVDALSAARTRFYSVIIVDYHLTARFTGLELINIMSRANLVSDTTGILMISGDARQQTVLTALSGRVRHLLTKPIQTKALNSRILLSLQEQRELSDAKLHLQNAGNPSINDIKYLHEKYPDSVCVESLLIDTLIDGRLISELEQFLPLCRGKEHVSRVCAEAFLEHHKGNIHQSIRLLSDYVIHNPLCLRALDNLTGLYETTGDLKLALSTAIRAFKHTPSNSQRMVTAVRVSAKLRDLKALQKIGHMYASKVSPTDHQWLSSMVYYIELIADQFHDLQSVARKKEILINLNQMFIAIDKQLPTKQKDDLASFKQLMQSKLLLADFKPDLAHKKLLRSMSFYFDNPIKMPSVLIKSSIPLLDFFGEFSLKHALELVLLNKSKTPNAASRDRKEIRNSSLNQYPFSAELRLQALSNKTESTEDQAHLLALDYLLTRELPPNWSRWLQDYVAGSFASQLPQPFSLHIDVNG